MDIEQHSCWDGKLEINFNEPTRIQLLHRVPPKLERR